MQCCSASWVTSRHSVLLIKINCTGFSAHLYCDNPEVMANFEFHGDINPFCEILRDLIDCFHMKCVLQWREPVVREYVVDKERLKQFMPADLRGFANFRGLDALVNLWRWTYGCLDAPIKP